GIRAQLDACNADSRLAAICRQSLAADPKERYACVADLRRALNIRRRFLERGIAGLLILMGMCLFCLGLGVFAQAESPADGRDLKDLTRGGWAISPDSRMTLTLEIRTRSPR